MRCSLAARKSIQTLCDADGIPLKRTWSLRSLMAEQPRVELSAAQFRHLHKLSGLTVPDMSAPESVRLKQELEEMLRLVEAVKTCPLLHDSKAVAKSSQQVPDGRVWPAGRGMQVALDWDPVTWGQTAAKHRPQQQQQPEDSPAGNNATESDNILLKLAKKSREGYFVAASPRSSNAQDLG